MWARAIEWMLGLWLVLSPFLFGHADGLAGLRRVDFAAGTLVVVLASLSAFDRLRRAHLAILLVATGLVAHGYLRFAHPAPPGAQNEILVGLVLVLVAIIPPESNEPPRSWRRFLVTRASAIRSPLRAPGPPARSP